MDKYNKLERVVPEWNYHETWELVEPKNDTGFSMGYLLKAIS